ncbi:MAG: methylenetetrahydrofolate reductase [Bdellovibrionales bacterium]
MRISEIIQRTKNPAFSFEIIPPPRGRSIQDLIEIVETLMPVKPQWFDVTSHASSAYLQEDTHGNLIRRTYKKRPGTLGICGVIQNRFRIDTVAHVLCLGFTREETEDALIELNYLGVENLLLVRGDNPNYEKKYAREKSFNHYAIDLVRQVVALRKGQFLEELSEPAQFDFCIGVAGYPEKHFEAPNWELDLKYLKAKVDAGADYIVSQMFFDNSVFHSFVSRCRSAGITVPIIPGLKILKSASQLKSIPRTFHCDIPTDLVDNILENPKHAEEIGMRWTGHQIKDLLDRGHNNIHLYVMNDAHLARQVIETVDSL